MERGNLVLSRKAQEKITITMADGRTIVVTVCGINGERVRIGVEADKNIRIVRSELE
jgi:carbon storage regulator CsrA